MSERYDVVVVGSGAGAWAMLGPLLESRGLRRLREVGGTTRRKILVLERAAHDEQRIVPPPELTNTFTDALGRQGMFAAEGSAIGGGTALYTGNVLRFQPSDFYRRRTLGDVEGASVADWPYDYETLAPFYDEVEALMGVAGDAGASPFEPPRTHPYALPAVALDRAGQLASDAARRLGWHPAPVPTVASAAHGRNPCARCGLCTAHACRYAARWSARADLLAWAEAGLIELRTNATVARITSDGMRATGVTLTDGSIIQADTIVVAANAIQTPRLLLASATPDQPHGLGNDSDLVGRNLMTHAMEALITAGHVPGEATLAAAGCTLVIQDFYASERSGVALPFSLEPRAIGDGAAFARMVRQDPAWAALDDATIAARHASHVAVLSMVEDLPRAENRVTLDPELRDRHGLLVPRIEYAAHALDIEAAAAAASRSRELLVEAGAKDIVSVPARAARFHLMGTCRMGDDPARSVVASDGRSHAIENLVIADSSVLVTSAGVNPSLTVQAVCRRIGQLLRERVG